MTDQTTNQDQIFETSIGSTDENNYKFEPIKGYPMLSWKGKRSFDSTCYYPAQLKEIHGEAVDDWRNKIYWGDNLQVMSHLLKDFRGMIDLIYIDPPFDSKADYKKTIELRGKRVSNDHTSFEEKQYSDIWNNDEYLQFMFERLRIIRDLLSPTGSVYVHCDYRKSHHLRCILDEIFGSGGADFAGPGFKNEIAYGYRIQGVGKKFWARKHDTILFYSKSSETKFKACKERIYYKKPFIDTLRDENGRYYNDVYIRDIWYKDETAPKVEILLDDSDHYYSEFTSPDIWDCDETKPFISGSKEYLHYPTQKSEGLLSRIISQMTDPGDIVFDCFMGSGTTQAVALKLGRRFIGADINIGAIQTTTKRLLTIIDDIKAKPKQTSFLEKGGGNQAYIGLEVFNVNNYDIFRNPVEAKDILIGALELDRFESGNLYDGEKDGRLYKIMPVNRITTRSDLNELIMGFDYKAFDRRLSQNPGKAVEKITLVCMGHEPDLAAQLITEVKPYNIDVQVLNILRDKQDLQFKRDSEARISVINGFLHIDAFYPMNLLQKLSLQKENVEDWREMVESIMVDWNYDGAVMQPKTLDIPEENELVLGEYKIPLTAGTIRVKITDLLSESLEIEAPNG